MENIYIMNQALEKIGVLDNYKSLIWGKRYIELGDCEVYAQATPENLSIFQPDYYIIRDSDDMVCRIVSVELETDEEEGDFLIVKGVDCRSILNQRIVWNTISFSGKLSGFIQRIINENIINPSDSARKISNFIIGDLSAFTDALELQCSYEPIGDKINEICRLYNYGSRVTFDGSNFVFSLYAGVDRSFAQSSNSYIIFSQDFENLKSSKYVVDKSAYASIALVGGTGEGNERVNTTVSSSTETGINRYEVFVDAKSVSDKLGYADLIKAYPGGSISTVNNVVYYVVSGQQIAVLDKADDPQNATLVKSVYLSLLKESGEERLTALKVLTAFDGEIEAQNTYAYKSDYNIGDIVQVNNEFGIKRGARIIEVIESFSDEGYSVVPTFEFIGGV
jgi:hypothetical protein